MSKMKQIMAATLAMAAMAGGNENLCQPPSRGERQETQEVTNNNNRLWVIAKRKASSRRYVTVWLVSVVCHQANVSVGECARTK